MFRKISFRVLLYILIALTCLTVITQIAQKMKGERTFRSELAAFDTARITNLAISDVKNGNKNIELTKTGNAWKMNANDREYRTDLNYIKTMIWELTQLKAERIAATGRNKWEEFEVTDSLALRVTVKGKSRTLADLLIGKFSYQPPTNPYDQQGKMTSYVRIAGEKEVYAVNGFLRMNLSPDVDQFRDKTIIRTRAGSVSKLTFQYPADSSFVMEKQGNSWIINGITVDSTKTSQYISSIEHMTGTDFADDALVTGQPVFKLTLESNSSIPVEVLAYAGDSLHGHIVTSSLNPGAQFSGKNGLTERLFKGRASFSK